MPGLGTDTQEQGLILRAYIKILGVEPQVRITKEGSMCGKMPSQLLPTTDTWSEIALQKKVQDQGGGSLH